MRETNMVKGGEREKSKLDLSHWDTSAWEELIINHTSVEVNNLDDGFEVKFDLQAVVAKISLEIAKNAIESFLYGDCSALSICPTGIEVMTEEMTTPIMVKWKDITPSVDTREDIEKGFAEWLEDNKDFFEEELMP
jgi:hypothetical protein